MSSRGPLPFCSQCVKALVYFDVQTCRLDIGNEKGDTPLHIAARWGYQGIIETLLQNGASTEIQNRLKETPLKCALNSKVAFFLSERQYDLKKSITIRRSGLCCAVQTVRWSPRLALTHTRCAAHHIWWLMRFMQSHYFPS